MTLSETQTSVAQDSPSTATHAFDKMDWDSDEHGARLVCSCGWRSDPMAHLLRFALDAWAEHLLGVAAVPSDAVA